MKNIKILLEIGWMICIDVSAIKNLGENSYFITCFITNYIHIYDTLNSIYIQIIYLDILIFAHYIHSLCTYYKHVSIDILYSMFINHILCM